jgi:hypothetical protein
LGVQCDRFGRRTLRGGDDPAPIRLRRRTGGSGRPFTGLPGAPGTSRCQGEFFRLSTRRRFGPLLFRRWRRFRHGWYEFILRARNYYLFVNLFADNLRVVGAKNRSRAGNDGRGWGQLAAAGYRLSVSGCCFPFLQPGFDACFVVASLLLLRIRGLGNAAIGRCAAFLVLNDMRELVSKQLVA